MSRGVNKVILVGRVGQPPELRYTSGGTAVVELSVATNRWDSSKKKETADWHRVKCWGQQAERAAETLTKGAQVLVEGSLIYRKWTPEGQRKPVTIAEIDARSVQLCESDEDESTADYEEDE